MELVTLERIEQLLRELNETMRRIDQRGEEQFKRGVKQDEKMDNLFAPIAALIPAAIAFVTQNVKVQVWEEPS